MNNILNNFTLLILAGHSYSASAQTIQQEINDQVWKPFIQAFNDRDTDGFMELHSKDVVRSSRDSKTVLHWNEYYDQQRKSDEHGKMSGRKRQLQLRFTERIANEDQAVEVGIYKTTVFGKDGAPNSFYGRFHVVLRKERQPDKKAQWKILVDTDSSEGNTISEQHFRAAKPLE